MYFRVTNIKEVYMVADHPNKEDKGHRVDLLLALTLLYGSGLKWVVKT